MFTSRIRDRIARIAFYLPFGGSSESDSGDQNGQQQTSAGDNDDDDKGGQQQTTGKPNVVPPAKPADNKGGEQETAEQKAARLEAEVAQLRQENGKTRVNAKEKAAQEARDAVIKDIGKTLGLIKDNEDADPVKLQQQIAEHQAAVKERDQELAVYRAAGEHQADPNKLLDSRRFLASIKDIDPTDSKAIGDAIKAAVDADESLKTTPARAAGASSADHSGGSGEKRTVKDVPLADAVAAAYGR